MPVPRFEVGIGAIDGANLVFHVSVPYQSGTVAYFLNGQLKRADYDDGWVESDPASGEITLKEAPQSVNFPDVVQFFFIDTSPVLPESVLFSLRGRLLSLVAARGSIHGLEAVSGMLRLKQGVAGSVGAVEAVDGKLIQRTVLRGHLGCVSA